MIYYQNVTKSVLRTRLTGGKVGISKFHIYPTLVFISIVCVICTIQEGLNLVQQLDQTLLYITCDACLEQDSKLRNHLKASDHLA